MSIPEKIMRRLPRMLTVALALASAAPAHALPDKPIRLIFNFSAGGNIAVDAVARGGGHTIPP